jgi:heterodisulfide reductase subunit A2
MQPPIQTPNSKTALVVGGGIAGMQAALDLAAMDFHVHLLECSASIGGNMARLDKTFPTNDCSTCMIAPRMVACARHPRIAIHTLAELLDVEGQPGRFQAQVRHLPRYVDPKACIGCGLCVEKCPKKVPNAYNAGLDKRKAIHFVHSQAIPMVPAIDPAACIYFQKGRCRICEKVCPTKAVRLGDEAREESLAVGAVILAGGYDLALVAQAGEYGHGRYANVVTSIEFERMLSATGPHGGEPRRPSDHRIPQRVAWIQCVASRDSARRRNLCSAVCCMAAVKQALLTKEHHPDCDAAIFFLDIRAHGKDFDRYVLRARDRYGVRFIRSMLSQVVHDPRTGNLVLEYYDRLSLTHRHEEFDLVVLSAGMKPHSQILPVLSRLQLKQNAYGFVEPDPLRPSHTSQPGILVCGTLDGPKDIPESVTSASAAAAAAAVLLAQSTSKLDVTDEPVSIPLQHPNAADSHRDASADRDPASDDPAVNSGPHPADTTAHPEDLSHLDTATVTVTEDAPGTETEARIGVFVCHCGRNIAGVIDVDNLREYALTLPGVILAEHFLFTCSTATQSQIQDLIGKHHLNRVVVAACSPRTHEPLFRETLERSGLNKYVLEMANIRDQCSWVHGQDPEAATAKARDLIRAATARAALLEPIAEATSAVTPRALIIGGGLAGMTAALTLAQQGFASVLVERETQLGGMARRIHRTLEGISPRDFAEELGRRLENHPGISVYRSARLQSITGGPGRFIATLDQQGKPVSEQVGAVIVACGGVPYQPVEYHYGKHPRVVTQLELEDRLVQQPDFRYQVTVMIQCIGSRRDDFPLCSRICCGSAVKNAIRIKDRQPDAAVYVLYRDIRTYGFKEDYYKIARDRGVVFLPFEPEAAPEVLANDSKLRIRTFDSGSQRDLLIDADLLVLSVGVRPHPESRELAVKLKLPMMAEGFFLEAHPKLNPLEFSSSGIYLCGLAHSPRYLEESLAQAQGAAGRASGLLRQQEIRSSGVIAVVNRSRCSSCLVCVRSCPYRVPRMDSEGLSVIDAQGCQGCGICVSECPAKAITLQHYTDAQISAQAQSIVAR